MATTYSREYNLMVQNLATDGIQAEPIDFGGKVRGAWFSKTGESEATGSTIYLTKLPAKSRVIGVLFACEDLGGTNGATLEIGDSGDTDRLVSAFDVSTAALAFGFRTLRTPTTLDPDVGFGYIYTAETAILATTATQALNTNEFWGCILYLAAN